MQSDEKDFSYEFIHFIENVFLQIKKLNTALQVYSYHLIIFSFSKPGFWCNFYKKNSHFILISLSLILTAIFQPKENTTLKWIFRCKNPLLNYQSWPSYIKHSSETSCTDMAWDTAIVSVSGYEKAGITYNLRIIHKHPNSHSASEAVHQAPLQPAILTV